MALFALIRRWMIYGTGCTAMEDGWSMALFTRLWKMVGIWHCSHRYGRWLVYGTVSMALNDGQSAALLAVLQTMVDLRHCSQCYEQWLICGTVRIAMNNGWSVRQCSKLLWRMVNLRLCSYCYVQWLVYGTVRNCYEGWLMRNYPRMSELYIPFPMVFVVNQLKMECSTSIGLQGSLDHPTCFQQSLGRLKRQWCQKIQMNMTEMVFA